MYRDNVTRNLAPTVARGFANAARAAGHAIAAASPAPTARSVPSIRTEFLPTWQSVAALATAVAVAPPPLPTPLRQQQPVITRCSSATANGTETNVRSETSPAQQVQHSACSQVTHSVPASALGVGPTAAPASLQSPRKSNATHTGALQSPDIVARASAAMAASNGLTVAQLRPVGPQGQAAVDVGGFSRNVIGGVMVRSSGPSGEGKGVSTDKSMEMLDASAHLAEAPATGVSCSFGVTVVPVQGRRRGNRGAGRGPLLAVAGRVANIGGSVGTGPAWI